MIKRFKGILKSKVVQNSIWLFILKIVNTVVPLITIPYITRILGANKYGLFSIALNWITYFQVIVEYGFGLTGARKVTLNKSKENVQKIYNNIISARIILFIFSFVLMNIISLISKMNMSTYICMTLLFITVLGTTFQLTWLFQGMQDMKFITIIDSISRIISVILIFAVVKSQHDIYLYCIFYSITLFLSSMISIFVARKKYGLKFKFSTINNIKSELNDGKELFASSATTKIFSGIGVTILGITASKTIVGIYSAILKIPSVMVLMFSPISQALFPYNSENFKKFGVGATKKIKKIFLPILFFYLLCIVIIIILRKFVIFVLFGSEYANYSIIVIPMLIQFILAIINNFIGIQILVASGNQKSYSRAFIIGSLDMVILNVILGLFFDIYGIAIANPVGEFILTLLLLYECKRINWRNLYD